ncbi:MAG: type transporter [Thermotoga sp.]|jgi:ABC-2 type transport system permease protein|nr:type transporter [Thermotoga sp.]
MFRIAIVELKRILKKRSSLMMIIAAPVLVVLISLLFMQGYNLQTMKLGIYNEDNSIWSSLVMRFIGTILRQENIVKVDQNYEKLLKEGKLNAVIVIPKGFAAKLYSKQPTQMIFISSPIDLHLAAAIYNVLDSVLADFQGSAFFDPKVLRYIFTESDYPVPRLTLKDSELRFSDLISPFIVFFTAILITVSLASVSTFLDREKNLHEMFLVYNLPARKYACGKILAYTVIGASVSFIAYALTVILTGDNLGFFVTSVLILLNALLHTSVGFLVSSISPDKSLANILGVSVIGISLFSSGFAIPISNLPDILRRIAMSTPVFRTMYALRVYQLEHTVDNRSIFVVLLWTTVLFSISVLSGKFVIRRG